ncbi:F-actin-capping protein subunit alpha [Toensbergia leucococca]|nr:F-actin-capping protein subunit alpha [Toensbergia leucococca]
MTSDHAAAVSSFVEGAPPGELADVIKDIKALTFKEPSLLHAAQSALEKYNEEQLATVKLPGSDQHVLISSYNALDGGRYYDMESQSSFAFDHTTQVRLEITFIRMIAITDIFQKASDVESYILNTQHTSLITSLSKALSIHAHEHYPTSTHAVFPTSSDKALAILLVSNKYSPSNFWNGRWRSTYLYTPTISTLSGTLKVSVHYYEDGNVRLTTSKPLSISLPGSPTAGEIIKQIANVEKRYQEELNRGFAALSEGSFKGLRRQLPVTRQKVEWEKIMSYRLGQDIGGGRGR